MARNDTIAVARGIWTQLTNANATAIRVQNLDNTPLMLLATSDSTMPTNDGGAIILHSKETLAADMTLAQLWPGVTGAARVWAKSSQAANVSVSHADA
jgi:hypothetical protein